MTRRIVLLIGALFLGGTTAAVAQRIETPYRFFEETQAGGLTVGYISTDKGSIGLGPNSGPVFGGRYHIRLSGPFFIEAEALYFPTTRAVLDTTVVDSAFQQVGDADLGIGMLLASIRFNLTGQRTWNRVVPFILLGVGGALAIGDDDAADENIGSDARFDFGTTFAGQLGAGIEWFPVERLAIRVDARNVLWQLATPQALLEQNVGRTVPTEEWTNNVTASVGVSIHF